MFIYLRFSFIYLHSASPVYIFVPACLHFPLTLFIFSAYAQNIERKTTPSCTPPCTKNYKAFWDNELNAGQSQQPRDNSAAKHRITKIPWRIVSNAKPSQTSVHQLLQTHGFPRNRVISLVNIREKEGEKKKKNRPT